MNSGNSADAVTSEDGTYVSATLVRVATVTVEADGFVTVDQEISVTSNGDSGRGGDKPPWLFRLHSRRGAEPPSRQRASVRSWRIETAGGALLAGQDEVDRREFRR